MDKMVEFKTVTGAQPIDGYTRVVPQDIDPKEVLNKRVLVDGNCYLVKCVAHTGTKTVTALHLDLSRILPPEYFADNRPIGKKRVLANRRLGEVVLKKYDVRFEPTVDNADAIRLLDTFESWSSKFVEGGYTVCVLYEGNRHYGQAKTFPLAVCDAVARAYDIKELRDE